MSEDRVIRLAPREPDGPRVDAATIALLRKYLALAEAGALHGVALVGVEILARGERLRTDWAGAVTTHPGIAFTGAHILARRLYDLELTPLIQDPAP